MDQQSQQYDEPWVILERFVEENNQPAIDQFLNSLNPSETARVISRLDSQISQRLFQILGPQKSADIFRDLHDEQIAQLLEEIAPSDAAKIVAEIPEDEQADILADMSHKDAEAILKGMPAQEAAVTRQLMTYPENTAGGVMTKEYLAYLEHLTVGDVVDDLQTHAKQYTDYHIQYIYIISQTGQLKGVLNFRQLLLVPRQTSVLSVMLPQPLSIKVTATLDELIQYFADKPFLGIPATELDGRLVGVVERERVLELSGERDRNSYLKASGIVGGDELRTMGVLERSSRRLSWLIINIFLNIIAASVIVVYQDTLAAVIALAVFLPIISDMSGCSGYQAVAVSIRELTLGLIKPYEIMRVVFKELSVGIINGIILGLLLGAVAALWKWNIYLGVVVGGALMLNTIIAVLIGGSLPLFLKWMKQDPALASGPILTTITDMGGFFLTLSFATKLLSFLK